MAKYYIATRDWKGLYGKSPSGKWMLFAEEDGIETGGDYYAQIYVQGEPLFKSSPQQIFDAWESLRSGDLDHFQDAKDENGRTMDNVIEEVDK